jgi:Flp pilus assembly pilin Flp
MFWLLPLFVCLALVALVTVVFVGSVRNARALRRDVNERFDNIQRKLEKQANALADELLARRQDPSEPD